MVIQISNHLNFKLKALQWASQFKVACYLDSNSLDNHHSKFVTIIAIGAKIELKADVGSAFDQLSIFHRANPGWLFGFFTYDLKNEIENLKSENYDGLGFPSLYFFVPEHVILIKDKEVTINSDNDEEVLFQIQNQPGELADLKASVKLKSRFSKQEYIDTVQKIKGHITRGDIYVTNFCQEFYAEHATISPVNVFRQLNLISPNPFNWFFRLEDRYVMCASPERFLAKRGNKLISQPIKGTAPRKVNPKEDVIAKETLKNHPKEQQENVMIVDLVRNDLTHSAREGTVAVEELFGIYSFKHVHQMISTVTCEMNEGISSVQAIKNSFPMGSMTGAPKVSSMQLMERYERSKRGVYSGAMGYFSPDGDFDFNVVIRTLLYNSTSKYLSFQVGSAITYHADPEKEYDECLLKAQAILEVLGQNIA